MPLTDLDCDGRKVRSFSLGDGREIRLYEPPPPPPPDPPKRKAADVDFEAFVARAVHPDSVRLLSRRQLEIAEMVGRGMARKKIARLLRLKVVTVDSHCAHACEALNIHSAVELGIFFALRGYHSKFIQPENQ
jgi:DNA-binding CsgD family transcriptional regulator